MFYFLFSQGRPLNLTHLVTFGPTAKFTSKAKRPIIFFLRPKDEAYSIEVEKGTQVPNNLILMELGRYLERVFTFSTEEFKRVFLLKDGAAPINRSKEKEHYNYLKVSFLALFLTSSGLLKNFKRKEQCFLDLNWTACTRNCQRNTLI